MPPVDADATNERAYATNERAYGTNELADGTMRFERHFLIAGANHSIGANGRDSCTSGKRGSQPSMRSLIHI